LVTSGSAEGRPLWAVGLQVGNVPGTPGRSYRLALPVPLPPGAADPVAGRGVPEALVFLSSQPTEAAKAAATIAKLRSFFIARNPFFITGWVKRFLHVTVGGELLSG
jgi:hypothetical protein